MNCLSCNLLAGMATIRSNRKLKEPTPVVFAAIFLLLVGNCQFVAASITWTAPPPQWTPTNPNDFRTVNASLLNGSTQEPLKWNYTLPSGSDPRTTRFYIIKGASDLIGSFSHDSGGDNYVIRNVNDYQTRFNIDRSEVATLIINKVTEREEAVYQCELETKALETWRYNIRVIVTVPASFTNVSPDQTVLEGLTMQLLCEATGKPTPNITWNRVLEDGSNSEVLHEGPTWDFPNINRNDTGTYRCTSNNGFGNPVSHKVKVDVTYPAKALNVSASKHIVEVKQSVSLQCIAEGNPLPTYTWMPCDRQQSVCHESKLDVSKVEYDDVYICTVANSVGKNSGNVSVSIGGKLINITLVITSESCTNEKYNQSSLWINLNKTFDEVFANQSTYNSSQLTDVRCGSITIDVRLKFNSIIRERDVIDKLRSSVQNGMLGEVKVNVSSITGTRPVIEKPTQVATTTPSSPSDSKTWIIVGAVLGSVALLVITGVIAWCVYRKRKCKKRDTKVHNNGSQGEARENVQGEGYVQVNKGYEDRSNRQYGGGKTSSAPPVLYDTAQTGDRGAVRGQPVAQYAVVDKSKKKPRKPRPGELQYAELAEFSTGQGGQRSSLSPTNRHTETQYADVNAM